jgi:hypothetical protein
MADPNPPASPPANIFFHSGTSAGEVVSPIKSFLIGEYSPNLTEV